MMIFNSPLSQILSKSSINSFIVHQRCPLFDPSKNFSIKAASTHYDELGVPENATAHDIKKAFITKSKELHPDINPKDPGLHEAFVKISAAYNILGNKESRKQYDLKLNSRNSHYNTTNYSYSAASPFGARDNTSHYANHSSWHESRKFHHPIQRIRRHNPYHKYVVIGSLLFMVTGAVCAYVIVNYRHKRYQEHVEEQNRKAHAAYAESKERARTNGIHKQLELLMDLHSHPRKNIIKEVTPSSLNESDS